MNAEGLAHFTVFFIAMTAAASCLSCLVDRGLLAWRASRHLDEDC